jgi:hypothetical protein
MRAACARPCRLCLCCRGAGPRASPAPPRVFQACHAAQSVQPVSQPNPTCLARRRQRWALTRARHAPAARDHRPRSERLLGAFPAPAVLQMPWHALHAQPAMLNPTQQAPSAGCHTGRPVCGGIGVHCWSICKMQKGASCFVDVCCSASCACPPRLALICRRSAAATSWQLPPLPATGGRCALRPRASHHAPSRGGGEGGARTASSPSPVSPPAQGMFWGRIVVFVCWERTVAAGYLGGLSCVESLEPAALRLVCMMQPKGRRPSLFFAASSLRRVVEYGGRRNDHAQPGLLRASQSGAASGRAGLSINSFPCGRAPR